jgi:hypothetical protein
MPYQKKRQIAAEGDSEQPVVKKSKGEKKAKKELTQGSDAEGNPYWEVSFAALPQTDFERRIADISSDRQQPACQPRHVQGRHLGQYPRVLHCT